MENTSYMKFLNKVKTLLLFQLMHTVIKITEYFDHSQASLNTQIRPLSLQLICRHNVDYVYTDKHRNSLPCSFS